MNKHLGKLIKIQPKEKHLHLILIILLIFILGVQVGIKKGRALEKQDLRIEYGYYISD